LRVVFWWFVEAVVCERRKPRSSFFGGFGNFGRLFRLLADS